MSEKPPEGLWSMWEMCIITYCMFWCIQYVCLQYLSIIHLLYFNLFIYSVTSCHWYSLLRNHLLLYLPLTRPGGQLMGRRFSWFSCSSSFSCVHHLEPAASGQTRQQTAPCTLQASSSTFSTQVFSSPSIFTACLVFPREEQCWSKSPVLLCYGRLGPSGIFWTNNFTSASEGFWIVLIVCILYVFIYGSLVFINSIDSLHYFWFSW